MKQIQVRFTYKKTDGEQSSSRVYITWSVDNGRAWAWNYHCEEIYTHLTNKVDGSGYKVSYVGISRVHGDKDIWFDHVMFRNQPVVVGIDDPWCEFCFCYVLNF